MCCCMILNRVNLISLCLSGATDFANALCASVKEFVCVCEIVRVCTYMSV